MLAHDSRYLKRVRSVFYSTGERADTSREGRAAAGAAATAPPQISGRLSSPHTHLNQASCSPVSHSEEPHLAG